MKSLLYIYKGVKRGTSLAITAGIAVVLGGSLMLSSCNDYLEVYPENALPTDKYWSTKEDVEATLMAGYSYLRSSVTDYLIPWGELRAGCLKNRKNPPIQKFEIKTTTSIANWSSMYKIVNTANLVLKNASKARDNDDTYTEAAMNSHLCEAYWLRALAYFYIVRNWRDAPLFTEPFESDENSYNAPQAPEADIIAQIKADLLAAIALDAAKEQFDTTWETKGRATKWALYALMTDVLVWNQEFEAAIGYADLILNSTSKVAPSFINVPTHTAWFAIFNPGNSSESIYEVQWSREKTNGSSAYQTNNLPVLFNDETDDGIYQYGDRMAKDIANDVADIQTPYGTALSTINPEVYVRTKYGSAGANIDGYVSGRVICWKYVGGSSITEKRADSYRDPNFIIYRVADIMLLKAEALAMRQMGNSNEDNKAALDIVNQIRQRTNLTAVTYHDGMSISTVLEYVLHERLMELAGEGKAWYDMLRMGRYKDPSGQVNFKQEFLIDNVTWYNESAKATWITSVLNNENAWYLPVYDSEIRANSLLEQNPYYN